MLDTLIRGAKIVDGTGKAAFTADVGILDGMIEAVGNLSGAQAFETIEAAGRVLTPGFIDMPAAMTPFFSKPKRSAACPVALCTAGFALDGCRAPA